MTILLNNANLFSRNGFIENQAVLLSNDGKISYIGSADQVPKTADGKIDLKGLYLCPGFVDIHVHGGKGITFGEKDIAQDLKQYSKWVAQFGVTGFLLSLTEPDEETLVKNICEYGRLFREPMPGAQPLGLHLEGPFINPQKKGALNSAWLHIPDLREAQHYLDAAKGIIKQVTIAPELPGAEDVAALFRKNGVTVALGHTNSDFETASKALAGKFNHVTHTFNAQSNFTHRAPGAIGAILASENVTAELIADSIHVHPAAMKILLRSLGTDRVVLITDAMAGTGMPDGRYSLAGHEVIVQDSRASFADGTLAGSTATLDRCVDHITRLIGYPLFEAVKMASLNPLRAIGAEKEYSSLRIGNSANFVIIDDEVKIHTTIVNGKMVFDSSDK